MSCAIFSHRKLFVDDTDFLLEFPCIFYLLSEIGKLGSLSSPKFPPTPTTETILVIWLLLYSHHSAFETRLFFFMSGDTDFNNQKAINALTADRYWFPKTPPVDFIICFKESKSPHAWRLRFKARRCCV